MEKHAIFLDIDGTLANFGVFPYSGIVSDENRKAIKAAASLGHYIFLNTGRAYKWISPDIIKAVNPYGVISAGGAQITVGNEVIYEKYLPVHIMTEILREFRSDKKTIMIGTGTQLFIMNPTPVLDTDEFIKIDSAEDIEKNYGNAKIQKLEVLNPHISEKQKCICEKYLNMFYYDSYYEGAIPRISKATAMLYACDKLNIPHKNCIAMGDSANDIDMLTNAGISVAMGNASDEVKKISNFISLPCNENGVAYALKKLLNISY